MLAIWDPFYSSYFNGISTTSRSYCTSCLLSVAVMSIHQIMVGRDRFLEESYFSTASYRNSDGIAELSRCWLTPAYLVFLTRSALTPSSFKSSLDFTATAITVCDHLGTLFASGLILIKIASDFAHRLSSCLTWCLSWQEDGGCLQFVWAISNFSLSLFFFLLGTGTYLYSFIFSTCSLLFVAILTGKLVGKLCSPLP